MMTIAPAPNVLKKNPMLILIPNDSELPIYCSF